MNYAVEKASYMSVAMSGIEVGSVRPPMGHCFVKSQAEWLRIEGRIPQVEGLPKELFGTQVGR
jgi:hypothetical protein